MLTPPQPRLSDRIVLCVELVKPMESVPVSVNVQHVHSQIIGGQVHRVEDLGQIHDLVPGPADRDVTVSFESFLDEPQQVFLIHAGGSVNVSINLSWGNI